MHRFKKLNNEPRDKDNADTLPQNENANLQIDNGSSDHTSNILFLSSITTGRPGPFLHHSPHFGSYLQEGGASCLGVVGSLVLPLPPFSLIEAGAGARDAVTWGQMGAILQLGLHKTNPSKGFWSFLGFTPKQEFLWGTVLKQLDVHTAYMPLLLVWKWCGWQVSEFAMKLCFSTIQILLNIHI